MARVPSRKKPKPFSLKRLSWNKTHLFFHSGGRWKSIPLRTEKGILQGVYRLRDGRLLEIRSLMHAGSVEYHAFANGKYVGYVMSELGDRFVNERERKKGIATVLFDSAERSYPKKKIILGTSRRDTLAFLFSRGYRGLNSPDVEAIRQVGGNEPSKYTSRSQVFVQKEKTPTPRDDPNHWHQIRVVGRDGREKILTLKVKENGSSQ